MDAAQNLANKYTFSEKKLNWKVVQRDGTALPVDISRIEKRLQPLLQGLDEQHIDLRTVVQRVADGISDGIKTTELDNLAAETCAYMNIIHPHYSVLAARIAVSSLHKETPASMRDTARKLYRCTDKCGRPAPLLSEEVFKLVEEHHEVIQQRLDFSRDFEYDFFGFKTLERSYLLRVDGEIVERPQHMIMRVALGIHGSDLTRAFETYDFMSHGWFTHATPTLFNAGTPKPQMSSCFLLKMKEDSIDGIYETLKQCALISKSAGGIGVSITNIRAKNSYIRGTNGNSNGIVPMLKVFNDTARYVDQGGGRRKGSFAMYIEPWHADIMEFLQLRKNNGKEELRARDLFYAIWAPDLFMQRVKDNGSWTLMCPNECPGLEECWGEKFEVLYTRYEQEGRGRKAIQARDLWNEIVTAQIETGTPYMLYKDACNAKSNQQNLGTIKSSNLCTEILEYTSPDEIAVCNLASIALPKFVKLADRSFDFDKLIEVTRVVVRNLNNIIDRNYYPIEEARNSNLRHRPVGIGIQGLADTFAMLKINYDGREAADLNEKIFEAIYFGAVSESCELAKVCGPYSSFAGSPASQGRLSFDLWGVTPKNFDFGPLREDVKKHGMLNSLLVAPMPTASTSQILGNTESFEPITTNIYTRRVLSGEFVCVNKHLVQTLIEQVAAPHQNLWTPEVRNKILAFNGSIQAIKEIPEDTRSLFRTVWELPQKELINLAVGRSPFIDQSQSLNVYLKEPTYSKISAMHFYGWEQGLKTGTLPSPGMYYLRSRPATNAIKFTVDVEALLKQSCEGFEMKHFNSIKETQPLAELEADGKENIDINLLGRKPSKDLEARDKEDSKPQLDKRAPALCPLRPKKKEGDTQQDDEECLACGS